jgi:hypothetical protein
MAIADRKFKIPDRNLEFRTANANDGQENEMTDKPVKFQANFVDSAQKSLMPARLAAFRANR